ncbi:membrane protein [Paraglaciecola mesophila KMM 241]|uniref:Membrane protein n=1 Tax=Paraglaciecola mesophila KMM 241 TaxID=1128912 RepID=K6ZPF6_9ALTE|nr:DMT family transporter [Paraglaciecola mesophila]GAC25230.1 membrane protein [Paraglaciecola mesophila KMM 241]
MKSVILYIVTVLIWGSTWLAIEFQLGDVPAQVSLVYRFAIAAFVMWCYCMFKGVNMRFSMTDHGFFMVLALCNFGLNYLILYWAQNYLTSAMSSIAFSTLLLMNIVNTRLFFGRRIANRIYIGALLGVVGLVALFWPDIKDLDFSSDAMLGLGLALGGTFLASLGNMASVRNSSNHVGVMQGNAWGMLYGTLALVGVVLLSDAQFTFSTEPSYVISLLYLSLFGTVIAFACYFLLLRDIGPEKASYSIVLFPIVAVILSTIFEGFLWHANTVFGFVLVLAGNAIVLTPVAKIRNWLG